MFFVVFLYFLSYIYVVNTPYREIPQFTESPSSCPEPRHCACTLLWALEMKIQPWSFLSHYWCSRVGVLKGHQTNLQRIKPSLYKYSKNLFCFQVFQPLPNELLEIWWLSDQCNDRILGRWNDELFFIRLDGTAMVFNGSLPLAKRSNCGTNCFSGFSGKNPLPLVPIANVRTFHIWEISIGLDGVAMVFNGSQPSAI